MTQTNEEIQDRMKKVHNTGACKCCDNLMSLLTTTKTDWLRSEIEKLEGEEMRVKKVGFENPETKMQQIKQRVYAQGHNQALTSIITRYKEELKVLESK